jgi:hypothetical protein
VKQSVSVVVDSRDRRIPLDGLVRSHEEVCLDPPGCPVCRYCGDAEEQSLVAIEGLGATRPLLRQLAAGGPLLLGQVARAELIGGRSPLSRAPGEPTERLGERRRLGIQRPGLMRTPRDRRRHS